MVAARARRAGASRERPSRGAAQEPRVITIAAKRFEFSPSEVRLKMGEPVTMPDVTYGIYMKALGIERRD